MIHKCVEEAKDKRRMRTMEVMSGDVGGECTEEMDLAAEDALDDEIL